MGNLPVSTVVDVTITRETIFPTVDGFGTQLIVTAENTGPLNAGLRTKTYRSMDEVAADWASTDEAYIAAQAAFSQKPCADRIKIGWRDSGNPIVDELDEIQAYDSDWYGLTFTKEVRDTAAIPLIAAWVEARVKVYLSASNDTNTTNPLNITNVAYLLKNAGYDRSAIFYSEEVDEYPDVAFLARAFAVDFTAPNSAITMKFKRLFGISIVDLNSAELQAVTGFVPGLGLDQASGHFANTYVTVGGVEFVTEGNMASGEWFDTIHFADWLQNAIQIEILGILVNSNKVPYTNVGIDKLVKGVDRTLQQGVANGGIASDIDEDTGEILPAYEIEAVRVENVPASQRAQRIAPDISFVARLAGAVHYATIRGKLVV